MSKVDLSAIEADLNALPPKGKGGYRCSVQLLVAEHPEAGDTLRSAIGDLRYSADRVADVLTRHGLKISGGTVLKHRKGTCTVCQGGPK